MGKGGKAEIEVTEYRMSLHWGICHGPIDALLGIYVGEKEAWSGNVTSGTAISIDRTDLFGGPKKEGGVSGTAHFFVGNDTQVMPEHLAARLGRTTATCPAYRGIASVFFHSSNQVAQFFTLTINRIAAGFLWGTNNPYLRDIWFKIRRSPKVLTSGHRMIGSDANPAAIIYECLTNTDWGMGGAPGVIGTASFESAAATLLTEGMGMSLMWTKQATIEAFVSEVLDHIQAALFVDPSTGLLTLKLFRDDYVLDDLPILNPDNCTIRSFDRKAWGETVNEIVVTWTNPENEQEETVSAQNLANITIQGAPISDSRSFYGFRNSDLAMFAAKRDLAQSSAPLAMFEIEADRKAWKFVPGGLARLQYPEEGIDDLVIRMSKVDYGKRGQPAIKLNAMEDIFSYPVAAYSTPDEGLWDGTLADPEPMNHVRVLTAPAYFAARVPGFDTNLLANRDYVLSVGVEGGPDVEIGVEPTDGAGDPDVFAAVLASHDTSDATSYELVGQTTLPNGEVLGDPLGSREVLGYSTLPIAFPAQATTTVTSWNDIDGGVGPTVGGFLFIGNSTEPYQEIAMIQSADEEDGWLIYRGVLDTVPRTWASGTPVWFVSRDSLFLDTNSVRAETETARFKLLPRASGGTLSQDDSPIYGSVLTARPHLPNRPANVTVGGAAFGTVDVSAGSPATVAATWANRNRLTEDSQVLSWTDATTTPEAGQTTTIRVIKLDGTILATHDGLTGTSFAIPIASFGGQTTADVKVTAKRDGYESLQGHVIRVKVGAGSAPPPVDPGSDPGGGVPGGPTDPNPGGGWKKLPPTYPSD